VLSLQPKNKDKDKAQVEENKKDDGEKLGCGRTIPIRQVRPSYINHQHVKNSTCPASKTSWQGDIGRVKAN